MFKFYRIKKLKPNINSVEARLPDVYKKYLESLKLPQEPVHYIPEPGRYKLDPESKEKVRFENREIPLKFPKEADEGIWGGEGVIQGFIKEKKKRRRFPNYWVPNLKKSVVYSEILNQYMQVTVTERTLKLIDQNYGFDHYILNTPVQDLKSELAVKIRRKMLLALLNKEKYHESEEKNKEVLEKYAKYMIPQREEAEWFGLTLREAIQKQKLIEVEQMVPTPLKHQLRLQLIEELQRKKEMADRGEEEEEEKEEAEVETSSWMSRLNPFSRKKDKDDN